MADKRVLTHNGEPDGKAIGVAFYHPGWRTNPRWVVRTTLSNGWVRRVFVDHEGRTTMTGWFFKSE